MPVKTPRSSSGMPSMALPTATPKSSVASRLDGEEAPVPDAPPAAATRSCCGTRCETARKISANSSSMKAM